MVRTTDMSPGRKSDQKVFVDLAEGVAIQIDRRQQAQQLDQRDIGQQGVAARQWALETVAHERCGLF